MTIKDQRYLAALLYGAYMYFLYQLIGFIRFGSILFSCPECDLDRRGEILFLITNHGLPYLIGVLSVVLLFYFARNYKIPDSKLLISFLVAVPFSFFFSLMGGLLGFGVALVIGVLPFLGSFFVARRVWGE